MKKFFKDFKAFIAKGNVVDMAVGVIIGAAFSAIVTSLVNDIVMPLISLAVGGASVADWKWVITEAVYDANGGLAAGGKKIFFKLLRLGKLDKLLIHQVVKGNFPFPPPAQLQNYIYGCVTNDNLTKGVKGVLDMHFVGFIFGHGNSPSLIIVRGGSTPCCRPLIAYLQRRAGLSTAARMRRSS